MEPDFTLLASGRSNEELIERIDNRQKFLPETIEASVAELQFRNHAFSDEELKIIGEDIQAQRANAVMVTSNPSLFNTDYKNSIFIRSNVWLCNDGNEYQQNRKKE